MHDDLKRRLDKIALVTPAMDPQSAQPDPQAALAQQVLAGQPPQPGQVPQPAGAPPGAPAGAPAAPPMAPGMAPPGADPMGAQAPQPAAAPAADPAQQQAPPPPPPGAIACSVADPNSQQGILCAARMQAAQPKMAALKEAMDDFYANGDRYADPGPRPVGPTASPAFTTREGRPAEVRRAGQTVFEQHVDDGSVRKVLGPAPPWYHAAKSASVSALSPQVPNASSYPYQNPRYTPAPQLARTPSLAARAIQANPVLAPRTPPPTPMPLGGPGRPLASPRTLPRLPGTSHSPLSPSGPPSGPGVAQWVKTATPEEDAQLQGALARFGIAPERLRTMRNDLQGMDQFAGGYQEQRQADDAMSANLARFAGTGLGGLAGTAGSGVMGAMVGAPAGALVGLGRGDVIEGAGRGLVRGGLTGLGAGAGAFLGRLAGGAVGHPELGHMAGLLGGGTAGWLGSGGLLGEPRPRHEKQGADDPAAGLPVAPEAGDMAQPAPGGDPGGDPGGGGDKGPKPPTPDQLHLRDATSAAVACLACANFDGQSCQLMHVPVAPSNLCDAFAPGPQLAGLNTQAIEQAGGAEVPPPKTAGLGPSPLRGEGHEKSAAGILGGIGRGFGAAGRWVAQGAKDFGQGVKDFGHRRAILGHGLDHPYTQADIHGTGVPRPPVRSLFSPLVGQERMQRFYNRYGSSMQVPNTPEMRAQHLYGDTPRAQTVLRAQQQAELLRHQAGLRNEAGDTQGYNDLIQQHQELLDRANRVEGRLGRASGVPTPPTGSSFGAPRTDYRLREGAALGAGLAGTAVGGGLLYGRSGRPPAPSIPGSVSGRAGPPPAPTPAAPTTPVSGGAGLPGPGAAAGGETAGTPPPTGEAAGPGWGEWLGGQMGAVGEHLKNNWQPYALGAGGVLGAAALIQALSARRRKQRRQELLAQLAEQEGYGKEGAARPGNLDLASMAMVPLLAGVGTGLAGGLGGAALAPKRRRLEGAGRGALFGRAIGGLGASGALLGGLGADAVADKVPEGLRPYAGMAGAALGGLGGAGGGALLTRWALGPASWEGEHEHHQHHDSKPLAPKHLTKDATYPGCGKSRQVQGRQKARSMRRRLRKRAAVAGLTTLLDKHACGCGCAKCKATAARKKVQVKRALVEGPPRPPVRVVHGPSIRTGQGRFAWQGRAARKVTDDPEYARFGVRVS